MSLKHIKKDIFKPLRYRAPSYRAFCLSRMLYVNPSLIIVKVGTDTRRILQYTYSNDFHRSNLIKYYPMLLDRKYLRSHGQSHATGSCNFNTADVVVCSKSVESNQLISTNILGRYCTAEFWERF